MKIYDKTAFLTGIFCACALPLFALKVISAEWWQWMITIAVSGRFLYIGLSQSASERERTVKENYHEASVQLYGKYAVLKTNLPIVIAVSFFAIALILRFAFSLYLPVWVYVAFVIGLTVAAAYSVGVNREIMKHIDNKDQKI